jgi:hypothetical protein
MLAGIAHAVMKPLAHHEQLGPLNRREILGHLPHLVPGQLSGRKTQLDHGIGQLGDTILVGRNAGPELGPQRLPELPLPIDELPPPSAELLAGRAEFGRLLIVEAELFLHSRREPLLDPMPERVGSNAGVGLLSSGPAQWGGQKNQPAE